MPRSPTSKALYLLTCRTQSKRISFRLLAVNSGNIIRHALKPFLDKVEDAFQKANLEEENGQHDGPKQSEFWALLMEADHMSVRQFLSS